MNKVKIGVVGGYRGSSMINFCVGAGNAEVVAICDNNPTVLEAQKQSLKEYNVTFYSDFEDFIKHDMDAVVLANFANEHAPFAIKAMKAGKHVLSEVLPVQTMKEAVELIETVEETGMIYAYAENYCYMPAPREMKKLYAQNKIGEFEYGECEYIHNCDPIWPSITYGDKDHWRNNMYATFYCTHSLGPIIHATGLRPVKVTGFEGAKVGRTRSHGSKSGAFGIEMVTLENDGIIKSIHGELYVNSIWYSMYGSKGRMECGREDTNSKSINEIFIKSDEIPGAYETKLENYEPKDELWEKAKMYGHGGSDFYCINSFIERVKGNKDADIIDVYEAMDMFLPGMFAYRSVLKGGIPMDIPNLRDKSVRDLWRNDTACTDPKVAGDMLLPTFSKGTPEIGDEIYDYVKRLWDEECNKENADNYRALVFNQGKSDKQ